MKSELKLALAMIVAITILVSVACTPSNAALTEGTTRIQTIQDSVNYSDVRVQYVNAIYTNYPNDIIDNQADEDLIVVRIADETEYTYHKLDDDQAVVTPNSNIMLMVAGQLDLRNIKYSINRCPAGWCINWQPSLYLPIIK